MNKVLMIVALSAVSLLQPCWSNPLPPYEIGYVKAFPPEIGIYAIMSFDISGDTIATGAGIAIINQGVVVPENWYSGPPFILDSSNTTGFAINPEGDSVFVDIAEWGPHVQFGLLGQSSPPIRGHYIKRYYGQPEFNPHLSFEFAMPYQGYTKVIINEINAGSTWNRCSNFIEFYNKADYAICLDNWRLVCDTIYDFPANAFIPPHGFYVVDECDFPLRFGMDYGGDNLYLLSGDSVVDQVGWSSNHGANVSFMRYPDGDADSSQGMQDFWGYNDATSTTFENGFPTRGAANRHECPGFVVIGAHADSVDYNTARIGWTIPLWDQTFSHSIVIRSENGFVNNPAEGQMIYQGLDQQILDTYLAPEHTYYYTIFAMRGDSTYSAPTSESQASITLHGVNINPVTPAPSAYFLSCYPNPFNAKTEISFSIPHSGPVRVAIYNITGELVEVLAERIFAAGDNSITWDAGRLPSAVYFYSIKTTDKTITEKAVLLK